MVNAQQKQQNYCTQKTKCQNVRVGNEGYFMLSKQSGDIGKVELEYIIRDHSMEIRRA